MFRLRSVVLIVLALSGSFSALPLFAQERQAQQSALAAKVKDQETFDLGGGVKMEFVRIKAGSFLMGSTREDIDKLMKEYPGAPREFFDAEQPQHEVRIASDFLVGKYLVTREEFSRFVEDESFKSEGERDGLGGWGYNATENKLKGLDPKYTWRDPGFAQTGNHPVVNVSWNDAKAFCEWASRKTGRRVELLTDEQWEYACRAGTTTRCFTGDNSESLAGFANVADVTYKAKRLEDEKWGPYFSYLDGYAFTSPVNAFKPNPWGLHDMIGNVWQWCADKDWTNYPEGSKDDKFRGLRGGCWFSDQWRCRSAYRYGGEQRARGGSIGFRVSIRLDQK